MIEPEMAFCDLHGNMDLAEEFLKYIFATSSSTAPTTWSSSTAASTTACIATLRSIVESSFERITYTEAVGAPGKIGTAPSSFP